MIVPASRRRGSRWVHLENLSAYHNVALRRLGDNGFAGTGHRGSAFNSVPCRCKHVQTPSVSWARDGKSSIYAGRTQRGRCPSSAAVSCALASPRASAGYAGSEGQEAKFDFRDRASCRTGPGVSGNAPQNTIIGGASHLGACQGHDRRMEYRGGRRLPFLPVHAPTSRPRWHQDTGYLPITIGGVRARPRLQGFYEREPRH